MSRHVVSCHVTSCHVLCRLLGDERGHAYIDANRNRRGNQLLYTWIYLDTGATGPHKV